MDVLITNQYQETTFDPVNRIHQLTAKPATIRMSDEGFKEMLIDWKETVLKTHPTYLLVNNRFLDFPISPTLQAWTMANIIPALRLDSVKKLCFVMPMEFISRLSLSQLSYDQAQMIENVKMAYFDNLERAHEWLLE
ncbi:MAG TPA: hypothetical protein DCS93_29185 [Microscillaceae bacterium]|nr:hypothetical protein [Microscillaceae bacterium]